MRTVSATSANLRVTLPDIAREPCLAAPLPPMPADERDYQVFGVNQTGALQNCDDRRRLAVAAGDMFNENQDRLQKRLEPPTIWERVTGREKPPKPVPLLTIEDLLAQDAARGRY